MLKVRSHLGRIKEALHLLHSIQLMFMFHFSGSYVTLFGKTAKSVSHDNCDVSIEVHLSFF